MAKAKGQAQAARGGAARPAPATEVASGATRQAPARDEARELDRLIHEPVRLRIVSALAATESLTFVALKALLGLTDGNLSVHARKLEDAGYVQCKKGFDGRVPRTDYRLTPAGRRALEKYVDHMSALIDTMRRA